MPHARFHICGRVPGERPQQTVKDVAEQRRAEMRAEQGARADDFDPRTQAGRVLVDLRDDFVLADPDDLAEEPLWADADRLAQLERTVFGTRAAPDR